MPNEVKLSWLEQYRIIPSVYPPINFFEKLVDPELMEEAWYLESLTNSRLRNEVGDIHLVRPDDRISGTGSSVVMAAFTHIGCPSRFTDGSYGVYYAAKTLETAVHETIYWREKFLSYTKESPGDVQMRAYVGEILQELYDVRQRKDVHDPEDYQVPQQLAKKLREKRAWGLVYQSVRHQGGECIAAFRPKAVSIPKQSAHLIYRWNGKKITSVTEAKVLIEL